MYKQEILWYNNTMIIHTPRPKSKKRKPTAKQRELAASWEAIVKKYEPKKALSKAAVKSPTQIKPYVRETPHYPSLNSGYHDCTKRSIPQYTGTSMIGIGTLHKSNAVPIFSEDDAKEQARMRRG